MKIIINAMKSRFLHFIMAASIGLSVALSSFAHHSQSEFDPRIRVDIKGTISKVEWKSPHARLYVDVIESNGETVNWNFELPSPNTLMRRGWRRNSLKPGDNVNVTGYRARNYPYIAIGRSVKDEDGKALLTGSTRVN